MGDQCQVKPQLLMFPYTTMFLRLTFHEGAITNETNGASARSLL
jgi:hypothetical protein